MTKQLNESSGRVNEHEPAPMIEKLKCDQDGGRTIDIRLAQGIVDMTDKTCQDCRRCIK